MSISKTTTDIDTLKINYLTEEMYEEALANDEINEDELYLTPEISVISLVYPVGSYFETSDTLFDPNVSWGYTWVLDTQGQTNRWHRTA